MREIKFRMWEKKSKKMYDVERINFKDHHLYMWNSKFYSSSLLNFKDVELMQYTGLHDKNGKEIYEGDIVRVKFRKGFWKYKDKMYYGYKNGSVEYCVDCFIVYINGYKETIYPLSSFGDTGKPIEWLEVIGNIYENPELLERSSNGN